MNETQRDFTFRFGPVRPAQDVNGPYFSENSLLQYLHHGGGRSLCVQASFKAVRATRQGGPLARQCGLDEFDRSFRVSNLDD